MAGMGKIVKVRIEYHTGNWSNEHVREDEIPNIEKRSDVIKVERVGKSVEKTYYQDYAPKYYL